MSARTRRSGQVCRFSNATGLMPDITAIHTVCPGCVSLKPMALSDDEPSSSGRVAHGRAKSRYALSECVRRDRPVGSRPRAPGDPHPGRARQKDTAQELRWRTFEASLDDGILRDYVADLPDFEELDALDRAFAQAEAHPHQYRSLGFLPACSRRSSSSSTAIPGRAGTMTRWFRRPRPWSTITRLPRPCSTARSSTTSWPCAVTRLRPCCASPRPAGRPRARRTRGGRLERSRELSRRLAEGARPKGRLLEPRRELSVWERSDPTSGAIPSREARPTASRSVSHSVTTGATRRRDDP